MIGIGLNVSLRSDNFSLTPCTEFLIAWYTGVVASAADAYLSKVGDEDREVFQGRSLKADGVVSATVPDILATDTITNSGISVLTPGNGTVSFTAGNCWDIEWKRGATVLGIFPCVTGGGLTVENVVDKDNPVTLVNPPVDIWHEHTDGGGSDYPNQFGFTSGSPIAPAAYQSTTLDWLGNPLEHPGSAKIPLQCAKAPVFVGDGVAYGTFDTPHVLSGALTITAAGLIPDASSDQRAILGGASYVRFTDSTTLNINLGGSTRDFTHSLSVGTPFTLSIVRGATGDTVVTLNDTVFGTESMGIGEVTFPQIISRTPTADKFNSSLYYLSINGSSYSFTEGTPTETALTVYDRLGNGNHITLSNASAGNWQLLERLDKPLLEGFTKDTLGYIPEIAGSAPQYPRGGTLVPDNPMQYQMPLMPEMLDADSGLNFWFTAGVQNLKTITEIETYSNTSDQYMYGDGKYLVCSEDQTGACLEKSNKYLGRT